MDPDPPVYVCLWITIKLLRLCQTDKSTHIKKFKFSKVHSGTGSKVYIILLLCVSFTFTVPRPGSEENNINSCKNLVTWSDGSPAVMASSLTPGSEDKRFQFCSQYLRLDPCKSLQLWIRIEFWSNVSNTMTRPKKFSLDPWASQ